MTRRLLVALLAVVLLIAIGGCTKLGTGVDRGNRTSTVVYQVSGHGTANVEYAATGTDELTRATGVSLPWQKTVHTTDHSATVYRVTATGGTGMGCGITINGVGVPGQQAGPTGGVDCSFIK